MSIRSQLRAFLRALRRETHRSRPRHSGDSLARTADEALGPVGTYSSGGPGSRSRVYDHIADAADHRSPDD